LCFFPPLRGVSPSRPLKAESQLRQAKEELETRVAERTQSLQPANEQLQQVEQELCSALEKERGLNRPLAELG